MMNFQHSNGVDGPKRMSLREEAMARAASARSGSGGASHPSPIHTENAFASNTDANSSVLHPWTGAQPQPYPSEQPTPNGVYWPQYQLSNPAIFSPPAPAFQSPPPTAPLSASMPPLTASEARKTWRLHGTDATQLLEDRRSSLLSPTGMGGAYPHDLSQGPSYSVRVISAENRIDPAGAPFTVYIISVDTNTVRNMILEHRYSEFSKLNSELQANHIPMRTSFPSKSWYGRVGNWTPSASWAPEKHEELVIYRKAKLDIWLVELCELLNRNDVRGPVRDAVLEFLNVSSAGRAPCDRANPVSWDGLQRTDLTWEGVNKEEGSKHAAGTEKHLSKPLTLTLGSSVRQATYTVMHMCKKTSKLGATDQCIPLDLLQNAKGLCFLTVVKAGFVISGRVGTGLIVSRRTDGTWSPPSAIGTVGMGWGALIGGDITDYLIVLNTDKAVQSFGSKSTVNLGGEIGVAMGPVGRTATGNLNATTEGGIHPAYAYAHSKGLFVGISLEGSVISSRPEVNAKFYGRAIEPKELLFGNVQGRPRAAQPLYDALGEAMGVEMPSGGWRPSLLFDGGTAPQRRQGQGIPAIVSPSMSVQSGTSAVPPGVGVASIAAVAPPQTMG